MLKHNESYISRTFLAPVTAPEFPPPLFQQPPSPDSVRNALSSPPFIWNGISLRVFREPSSLSDFARLEERGKFLNREHKRWYVELKSALERDLEVLKKHHEVETEMGPSLRAAVEVQETREFHEEFMGKLGWGEESSPLLLRPANFLDNGPGEPSEETFGEHVLPAEEFHKVITKFVKQGLKTDIPSIRTYFENYPGLTVAWAVQDFYRRQVAARVAAKLGLELQQMWDWNERHWNFFKAVTKLRKLVRGKIGETRSSAFIIKEYDTQVLNWNIAVESQKRRHQWAVLKLVMKVYEARDEKFPEIQAPSRRSFGRYFGKYGKKEGWYPVDKELESRNNVQSAIIQQIDGVEKALEAGESLVQACASVCVEGVMQRPQTPPPPQTTEEVDALMTQMRSNAASLTRLGSEVRDERMDVELDSNTMEELPDPTDDSNGDAKVETQSFLSTLRNRLIGNAPENPETNEPVQDWLTSWRNPRASPDSFFLARYNYVLNIDRKVEILQAQWPGGLKA